MLTQTVSEDLLWSQLVARAWCDETLMKRLLSDPRELLVEHGLEVPPDAAVEVVEGEEVKVVLGDSVCHFMLPLSPPEDLTEEDLVVAPVAQCFSGACRACGACGWCGRCGCRCGCRCF